MSDTETTPDSGADSGTIDFSKFAAGQMVALRPGVADNPELGYKGKDPFVGQIERLTGDYIQVWHEETDHSHRVPLFLVTSLEPAE